MDHKSDLILAYKACRSDGTDYRTGKVLYGPLRSREGSADRRNTCEGRRRADVWYAGHGDAHDEDPARTPRTWESYTTNLTARPQARLGPEGKSHAVAGQEARGLAQGPAQGRLTDGQRDPSALLPFALQVGTCRPLKNFSTRNSFFSCIKIVARYPAYQAGRTSPQPAGVTGRTHTVLHFLQSHLHSGRGAAPTGELRHEH